MLKFFRKIRFNLMDTGKTSKYLKYAIGEIILVVIGILIALQINNWNEHKKERNLEVKILGEIQANLKRDHANLIMKINETEGFKLANHKVLDHLQQRTPLNDSLKFYYSRLNAYGNFRAITAGYENLKSIGLNLIQNDTLRSSISELYDYHYFHFVEDIIHALEQFRANKSKYVNDRIYLDKEGFTSGVPYDLNKLQNDETFKGYLNSTLVFHTWMNERRQRGLEHIEYVVQQIENELNK
jgi:Family of unknown function (DUF6090)